MSTGGPGVVAELQGVDRVEHGAVRAEGWVVMIFDNKERDDIMGEAEVYFLIESCLTETNGDRDEKAFRETGGRGAARKMGVEFLDIGRVSEGVAGAEGENR